MISNPDFDSRLAVFALQNLMFVVQNAEHLHWVVNSAEQLTSPSDPS